MAFTPLSWKSVDVTKHAQLKRALLEVSDWANAMQNQIAALAPNGGTAAPPPNGGTAAIPTGINLPYLKFATVLTQPITVPSGVLFSGFASVSVSTATTLTIQVLDPNGVVIGTANSSSQIVSGISCSVSEIYPNGVSGNFLVQVESGVNISTHTATGSLPNIFRWIIS